MKGAAKRVELDDNFEEASFERAAKEAAESGILKKSSSARRGAAEAHER